MRPARVALEVVSDDRPSSEVPVIQLDFDTVFRRYGPYVAAVAHRLLGRDDEVDDTVQEVFLVAVRGLARVRDPLAVKSWLARIAVRVARRRLQVRRFRSYLGMDGPAYLRVVVFLDGDGRRACDRDGVFAVASPGNRIVHVCPRFRERENRDPRFAQAVVIHEALHTLGLGENPPTSDEITARVLQACIP